MGTAETKAGPRLGELRATAICGNDISSSVLYVSALAAAHAGVLAPIVLLCVGGVLFLYRKIYGEVGSALPLNGGTYTVLLNTTSKQWAAAAACLTLLSYVATAVISASEAMHYGANLIPAVDIGAGTIALLGAFALLAIRGISESARVAVGIFVLHLATLIVLSVAGIAAIASNPELFVENFRLPPAHGIAHGLFFGFAAAMLGISGFESSANYIEEQQDGVFPKTLRNMWIVVMVFNPLISLLSLGLLPLGEIERVPPDLLAQMGDVSAGAILRTWVSVDAVLVLSGAVLTSFVGVTGLVRRMSLDRVLPQVLLRANHRHGTNHWIVLAFFLLCASIYALSAGRIETLAGVYALSFLSVMALFAIGNMLLKRTRSRLPRAERAGWLATSAGLAAVLVGIAGNLILEPENFELFALYAIAAFALVGGMFLRLELLKLVLFISQSAIERLTSFSERVRDGVRASIRSINERAVVYFTKDDDVVVLNRAALYVLRNEQTSHLMVVHAYQEEAGIPPSLAQSLTTLDQLYPRLRIDFVAVKGRFGPELIERLSAHLRIPKNAMFIGTPGDRFPHRLRDLGGVRVIL